MIEMRKLQKLGKVELLELVRELTEELEEVRFKNDVLLKAGGPAEREEKSPPGPGEPGQAPHPSASLSPSPSVTGSPPGEWERAEPGGGWAEGNTQAQPQPLQAPTPPRGPTAAFLAGTPPAPPAPPIAISNPSPRETQQGMLEELEGFRRSIREICEIAERTRQEMDGCMTRVELAVKHREEEARQMAEQAYGKSEDVLRTLQEYKRQTEETLAKMMETVTSLQRVIQ